MRRIVSMPKVERLRRRADCRGVTRNAPMTRMPGGGNSGCIVGIGKVTVKSTSIGHCKRSQIRRPLIGCSGYHMLLDQA